MTSSASSGRDRSTRTTSSTTRRFDQECEKKYGKPIDLAIKSTFNPRTKKYHGFSDSYAPDPINYRKDLWDEIGMKPDSWDDIRVGGAKIKQKTGIPVGIGLSSEIDTAMAMRALLYSFGGSEQDDKGKLILNSKNTVEAVKFVTAMYKECMTPEVLAWDASSNNRAMLAGKISVALNAISITRSAENDKMPISDKIRLAKAAKGPTRRMGLEHVMSVYVIRKFAENIDGAKKFLVDYVGNFHQAFEKSEAYNFPCLAQAGAGLQAARRQGHQGTAARQVRGARRFGRLGDQRRLPRILLGGDRRRLQHLGAEHHVRPGRHRRAHPRGRGQRRPRRSTRRSGRSGPSGS